MFNMIANNVIACCMIWIRPVHSMSMY